MSKSSISGNGCFAVKDLEKNEFLEEYTGQLVPSGVVKCWRKNRRQYLAQLTDVGDLMVDGENSNSSVTRANHSTNPNSMFVYRVVRTSGGVRNALYLKATRIIPRGTEVTVDYGPYYDYSSFKDRGAAT